MTGTNSTPSAPAVRAVPASSWPKRRRIAANSWEGESTCEEANVYRKSLPARREKEAQSLASLTGWDINVIRSKMNLDGPDPIDDKKWWEQIWN